MTTPLSLAIAAVLSIAWGALNPGGHQPMVDLLFSLALGVCAYAWYRADSIRQRHLGSTLLAGGVILLPIVSLPYYLYRSRAMNQRGKAVGSFVLLALGLVLLNGIAAALRGGLNG